MNPRHAIGFVSLFLLVILAALVQLMVPGCRMTYNKCEVRNILDVPKGAGDLKSLSITTNLYSASEATLAADKSTPIDALRGVGQGGAISAAPGAAATQSGAVTVPPTAVPAATADTAVMSVTSPDGVAIDPEWEAEILKIMGEKDASPAPP